MARSEPSGATSRFLSPDQKARFERDGYLVLPQFMSKDQVTALHQRSRQMLHDFDLASHPMTKFTTGEEGAAHVGDDYFLESGDKIRFFFEEKAFDDKGKLTRPKEAAINKVGHALHELDPTFKDFTFQEKHKQIARDLGRHRDPLVLQSMVITKQPGIGGKVPVHDDSTFLWTEEQSAIGFWFPLEDCTLQPVDNGCLSFAPGSHKKNRVASRFVRLPEGGTGFRPVQGVEPVDIDWEQEPWETIECQAGSLVLIDGKVIHRSPPNLSDRSRFIYAFHMIDGALPYPKDNWLQPTPEMPFSRLYDH